MFVYYLDSYLIIILVYVNGILVIGSSSTQDPQLIFFFIASFPYMILVLSLTFLVLRSLINLEPFFLVNISTLRTCLLAQRFSLMNQLLLLVVLVQPCLNLIRNHFLMSFFITVLLVLYNMSSLSKQTYLLLLISLPIHVSAYFYLLFSYETYFALFDMIFILVFFCKKLIIFIFKLIQMQSRSLIPMTRKTPMIIVSFLGWIWLLSPLLSNGLFQGVVLN